MSDYNYKIKIEDVDNNIKNEKLFLHASENRINAASQDLWIFDKYFFDNLKNLNLNFKDLFLGTPYCDGCLNGELLKIKNLFKIYNPCLDLIMIHISEILTDHKLMSDINSFWFDNMTEKIKSLEKKGYLNKRIKFSFIREGAN